jgi:hypothetical protein
VVGIFSCLIAAAVVLVAMPAGRMGDEPAAAAIPAAMLATEPVSAEGDE